MIKNAILHNYLNKKITKNRFFMIYNRDIYFDKKKTQCFQAKTPQFRKLKKFIPTYSGPINYRKNLQNYTDL